MTLSSRQVRRLRQFAGATTLLGSGACGVSVDDGNPTGVARQREALSVAASVIGTDPPAAVQYNTGGYLSSAHDGTNALVVFYDGGEIRGMRYDAQGQLLDLEQWLQLGRNDDGQGAHAYSDLAYGDGVYLALFTDSTEGETGIDVQPVAANGEVLAAPVLVGPGAYYGAVVFNGTDFTVVWSDGDLTLARVGLDGQLVAGTQTAVTTRGGTNRPVLAMSGDVGLLAFEQEVDGVRQVYAARFDAEGSVLDPEGFLVSDTTTSSVNVSVAAGSDEFAVVWSAGSTDGIYGSMVGKDGSVARQEFPISGAGSDFGGSTVAHDGTQYLVAWQTGFGGEGSAIRGTRMSSEGTLLDDDDVLLASPSRAVQSWDVDLTWADGRFLLNFIGEGVEGRFLDSELNVLDPGGLQLSALPSAQNIPAAAWNGQTYVLGWSDERNQSAYQFRAGRIDDAGNRLDPDGIAISAASDSVGNLGVASNGQTTMFTWRVWGDEPALYKRWLDADGELSEPEQWLLGADGGHALSSDGDGYLALFTGGDNGSGNDNEIWGQPFDGNAQARGEAVLLVTISRPRYGLWGFGDEHLLAYSGQEAAGTPITGAVVALDGMGQVTAEYEPVLPGMLTASAGGNGEHLLFSWQDDAQALWGRVLSKSDGWGEPFIISDQVTGDTGAIAWDGSTFVVVWPEERTAMWTRNVGTDGALSEPEQLFAGDYGWVRLTPGADGQMLLSYVRWLEWSRSRRIESRLVGDVGMGVVIDPIDVPDDPIDPVETDAPVAPSTGTDDDSVTPGDTPTQPEPEDPGSGAPAIDTPTPTDAASDPTETTTDDGDVAASDGATDAMEGAGDAPRQPAAGESEVDASGDDSSCGLRAVGSGRRAAAWWLGVMGLPLFVRRRGALRRRQV